jgi:type IV pilus secretin PilQ/predicted competence protein
MKRKNYLLGPPFLFLLVILIGYANSGESLVDIDKVLVQPGKLNTKIILDTNSPLPAPKTYYSKDIPSTIVVELDNVKMTKKPQFDQKESSLIKDIKIEKAGPKKIRCFISLKEPVPYRIITNHKSTVVELTKIQRALREYVFDSEAKKELGKASKKKKISLEKIDISETKDSVNITAKLSSEAVSNVFALDNPLRLVVDLFDTLYSNPTFDRPIKKLGVEKVRAAQFQYSNPNTITRIVFDLNEAGHYALDSAKDKLTISFFKEQAPLTSPRVPTAAPEKTESKKPETPTIEKILKEFEKRSQKEKDATQQKPSESIDKDKDLKDTIKKKQPTESSQQKSAKSETKESKETPTKQATKQVIEKISQKAVKNEPKEKESKELSIKPEVKQAEKAAKTQLKPSESVKKDKDKEPKETIKKTQPEQIIKPKPAPQEPIASKQKEPKETLVKPETKQTEETASKILDKAAQKDKELTNTAMKTETKQEKETPVQKPVKVAQKEEQPEETIVLPKSLQRPAEKTEKTKDSKSSIEVSTAAKPTQPNRTSPAQSEAQQQKFMPKTIAEEEQRYEGAIMDLRVKDADLRDVILSIGEIAGLNTVFDPEVRGTVTCDLKDIPWDQALDLILKINKMGKAIEGNVLRIAPPGTLTREREEQNRLKQSEELAEPLITKTFKLSYSKANDVSQLLRSKISSRGDIVLDARTNTLIITDVRSKIELIERLLSVFDTPTPQVSIEARIVEATATFSRNLGIQWGFKGIADPFYGNQTSLQFPHKVLADGALIPQGTITKGIGGPLGGYAINLPAPAFNTAVGLSFGNILDTFRLDMALSALESSGEGQIISCPRITTQNNKEAEIIQGRQIPVQTVANFTTTVRYQNAALELRATPQITAEGTIIMDIDIQNNAADFANLVNGIPPLIRQSASTTVMVPDGGTTVIGGIYRTEDSITRERVPLLHKIPILGSLFRSFARTKQNRELLIFITPRIIKM